MLPVGVRTSSMKMDPVTDARRDTLFLIWGAERPFIPFSSTKPRILPSHAHLAQTTKTSAMGELEIHVLAPVRLNPPPPGISVAVVVIPAGSDPWSGSVNPCNARQRCRRGEAVRTKHPTRLPVASSGRNRSFNASDPKASEAGQ